jgi:hypothetical protein
MPAKTKKVSDITQAAEPKTKQAPAVAREVHLTEFQKQLCELFGDMIMNRADEDDLGIVLNGLMRHEYRRKFEHTKHASGAPAYGDNLKNSCVTRVVKCWPDKKASDESEPGTVTEYVRRAIRWYLESDFEEFVTDASPEERHFMHEVMITWQSNTTNGNSVCLANAFEAEIKRNRRYVFVPREDLVEEVEHFVEVLSDGPKKAA